MTPAPAPRVLLVDDELQLRLSLRYLLEVEDVTVVGEAADGPEAVLLAGASVPDVVLMDLRLPTMDGLEATRQIRRLVPATQVVIFTAFVAAVAVRKHIQQSIADRGEQDDQRRLREREADGGREHRRGAGNREHGGEHAVEKRTGRAALAGERIRRAHRAAAQRHFKHAEQIERHQRDERTAVDQGLRVELLVDGVGDGFGEEGQGAQVVE